MSNKTVTLGKGLVSVGAGRIGDSAFIRFDLLPDRRPIGTDLLNERLEFLDTVRVDILNLEALEILEESVSTARKILENKND